MTPVRVFFHVQHLLGVGHLKRAAAICRALAAAGFEVTLASGGLLVPGVVPETVKPVQLAPLAAADVSFKKLVDEAGAPVTEAWKAARAAALIDAWRAARAQVLIVELFPFGRRSLRFELLPLLEEARGALVLCSVRDILQPRPDREEETVSLIERHFHGVLVHGDPRVATLEASFGAAARIAGKVHYTGYVVDELALNGGQAGHGEVLVSAGGGAVGTRLIEAALQARALTRLRERTWRVVAGVNADLEAVRRLAAPGVEIERARQDFTTLLANCELSISQAGYNTVMETLQARARAVLVPYSAGAELEQALRARLFAERGLVETVQEASVTAESLARAVDRAAARPRPAAHALDMGGARASVRLISRWTA